MEGKNFFFSEKGKTDMRTLPVVQGYKNKGKQKGGRGFGDKWKVVSSRGIHSLDRLIYWFIYFQEERAQPSSR